MTTPQRAFSCGAIVTALFSFTLLLAGCASDDAPRPRSGRGSSHEEPAPTLAGQETFFEGKVVAELKVGAMTGFDHGGEGAATGSGPGGGGHHRRGGHGSGGGGDEDFSLGMGGGMGMGGMGGGGPPRGGEGGPDGPEGGRPAGGMRRSVSSAPPVMIHLRFTNHGTEPVELVIADFLSPLGNFVVTPAKLTLAPGASAEVEPMSSGLAGQVTGGEITLKLRLGAATETRSITLKPEAPAAAPGPKS